MRRWLVGFVAVGVVALLVWANLRVTSGQSVLASPAQAGPAGAPLVKVIKVGPRDLVQTVTAPGILEATEIYRVRAPFGSQELRLRVDIGDRVDRGDLLAELDDGEMRAQTSSLEAALARAEANLSQLRWQQRTGPQQRAQRLESARAQLKQAEANLAHALAQPSPVQQRVEQARANLLALQSQATGAGAEIGAAVRRVDEAEQAYEANPLDEAARQELGRARTDLEALRARSESEARRLAAELAVADEALRLAEAELELEENPAAVVQARHQVENARQAVAAAELEIETAESLAGQIRAAEAEVSSAREALRRARDRLAQNRIVAAEAGTMLAVGVRHGQPVQAEQILLEIGSLDRMTVKMRVDELDIGKVAVGQAVSVRSTAHPQTWFDGTVKRVAAQTSQGEGAPGAYFEVHGEVENQGGRLRAGMNAENQITTDRRSGVLVVGLESVREEGEKVAVLVVSDFKVQVRPVKLGLRTQTQVEVLEGLSPGDQVVVSPFTLVNSLKEGDSVRTELTELEDRGGQP